MCIKIVKFLRCFFKKIDSFPSTQFLRYRGQTEYSTATGGIVSLATIIVFVILFASRGLDVLRKVNVTATSDFTSELQPSAANITAGPNGDFMFAISIPGVNFSDPTVTVFQIILAQQSFTPIFIPVQRTVIPMTLCTVNHLSFNQQLQKAYYTYNLSNWLCPPVNYQFQLQGKLSSALFKQFSLTIKKCNTSIHSNCLGDAGVAALQAALGYFTIGVAVINKQLNPSSSDIYQSFYVNDKNYFGFTTNLAVRVNADVQSYEISTDSSLFPFSDQEVEDGLIIGDVFDHYALPVANDTYFSMAFRKSSIIASYNRTFTKVDDFLAYIGGLIGTIIGLFYIMGSPVTSCHTGPTHEFNKTNLTPAPLMGMLLLLLLLWVLTINCAIKLAQPTSYFCMTRILKQTQMCSIYFFILAFLFIKLEAGLDI